MTESSALEQVATMPLRLNAVGALPAFASASIMAFPGTLVSFGLLPEEWVPHPASAGYWILNLLLVFVLTYLLTSWIFSGRNAMTKIEQFGYSISGVPPGQEPGAYLDRLLAQYIAPGALFLGLLAALPAILTHWLGLISELSPFYGPSLLVLCAVLMETFRSVRHHGEVDRITRAAGDDARPLAVVATFETELEVELARQRLGEMGIEAHANAADRIIPLTGAVMPWEVCRPTFPSLVVHRRLGGGRAQLLIAKNEIPRASAILAEGPEPETALPAARPEGD